MTGMLPDTFWSLSLGIEEVQRLPVRATSESIFESIEEEMTSLIGRGNLFTRVDFRQTHTIAELEHLVAW